MSDLSAHFLLELPAPALLPLLPLLQSPRLSLAALTHRLFIIAYPPVVFIVFVALPSLPLYASSMTQLS